MKLLVLIMSLTCYTQLNAQNKQCYCGRDSSINVLSVYCDTIKLSNYSLLYWQYNCDSIWLTLENDKGTKVILDNVSTEIYDIFDRGSFHFIKEFAETILFESGCAANGPCLYYLIDKNTGKEIESFNQLICIYSENGYNFDFVVYLSNQKDTINIYYINSKRKLKAPFSEKLSGLISEYLFETMTLENNILTLIYRPDEDLETRKTLTIDLSDERYSR